MSISEKEKEEYRAAFLLFDKDNSGSISKKELGAVMQSLGLKPNEKQLDYFVFISNEYFSRKIDLIVFKLQMKQVDSDNNGTISFDEFLKLFSQQSASQKEEDMKRVFKMFDKDDVRYVFPFLK
jgi:calmodulin